MGCDEMTDDSYLQQCDSLTDAFAAFPLGTDANLTVFL